MEIPAQQKHTYQKKEKPQPSTYKRGNLRARPEPCTQFLQSYINIPRVATLVAPPPPATTPILLSDHPFVFKRENPNGSFWDADPGVWATAEEGMNIALARVEVDVAGDEALPEAEPRLEPDEPAERDEEEEPMETASSSCLVPFGRSGGFIVPGGGCWNP